MSAHCLTLISQKMKPHLCTFKNQPGLLLTYKTCGGHDALWLLRLFYRKKYSFCSFFSFLCLSVSLCVTLFFFLKFKNYELPGKMVLLLQFHHSGKAMCGDHTKTKKKKKMCKKTVATPEAEDIQIFTAQTGKLKKKKRKRKDKASHNECLSSWGMRSVQKRDLPSFSKP